MKIALIGNSDISIYTYRYELIERLIADGHSVTVITPQGDRVADMMNMGCSYIETFVDRHGTNPIKDIALFKSYKRILKEIKPDVVFSYTIKPNIYASMACAKLNIPIVVNVTGLGTAVENPGWKQLVTTMLYKIAFRKVKTVFFQNEDNMQFFKDRSIATEKHKLLPGSGVNLVRFKQRPYPSDETVRFIFISRLMKEKGIEQYLEAAEFITEKYTNTEFHICGFCEDGYKDRLSAITENKRVIYHGMLKDVTKVLSDMHCTVHPTYYPEGLSNVLLESCATGRPIITTNRAGCREVIDDGINGFICLENDAKDLIRKIEKFLEMPNAEKEKMGIEGRKKVERQFDRNIVIEAYLRELEGIKND